MKKILLILAILAIALPASAATIIPNDLLIDFRDGTVAANSDTAVFGPATVTSIGGNLYQDNIDGVGVLGGEYDEIDLEERLVVDIGGGLLLTGVWITDLFDSPDGGNDSFGEYGWVVINDTLEFDFFGKNSDPWNGEQLVSFGKGIMVTSARFFTDSRFTNNNEFSVAGFAGSVPEPAPLLLLGTGLIGLAGLSRKRLIKK